MSAALRPRSLRRAGASAALALAGCGVVGFEPRVGAGAVDADDVAPACAPAASDDWAAWPMPTEPGAGLPNPARRTLRAGGAVVVDQVTGLHWERAPSPTRRSWDEAVAYCDALVLDGCDAWRLPSRIELATLVDHTRYMPTIDEVAFPVTDTGAWWWSATSASAGIEAWVVNFVNGNSFREVGTVPGNTRCVRGGGGARRPPARYQVDADVVTDLDTGLTWQRVAAPTAMTYDDAAATCQALTLAGGGWRLPAIGELHSLSVTGLTGAAIDLTAFPGAALDPTWSATPILGPDSAVMVVNFDDATVNNAEQVDLAHPRCVR